MEKMICVGDVVQLNTGWTDIIVDQIRGDYLLGHYRSGYELDWRHIRDFHLVSTPKPCNRKKEKKMSKPRNYRINAVGPVGIHVGTNTQGELLLEFPGGSIAQVPVNMATEVVPYTVALQNLTNGQRYHVQLPEGSVEPGDLLVKDTNLFKVLTLDTRNSSCGPMNGARKVLTETIS